MKQRRIGAFDFAPALWLLVGSLVIGWLFGLAGILRARNAHRVGVVMSPSPAINHSQERSRAQDAQPWLSHWAFSRARGRVSPIAILLPAYGGTRQLIRSGGRANGLPFHALAHQLPVKLIAAALIHLRRALSTSSSCSGSRNASKRGQIIGYLGQIGAA
jgi:hypothetical protein